jgi:site-specific DNA-methyltransferase (adenine-specific)
VKPYYEDDAVTIYHADCREILPTMSADAMVTDPPYGVALAGKSTKWTPRSGVGYASHDDTAEAVERDVIPTVAAVVYRMRSVVTPGVRMMWRYPEPTTTGAIYYPSGAGPGRWGFVCWQPIFYYGKCPYLAAGMGSRPDSFSTTEAAEANGHPVPKPIKTMRWLVAKATLPGQVVLDPFMGSGTTLRAAKDLGRRAIGIEIDERYCEIAARRMGQEVMDFGDVAA